MSSQYPQYPQPGNPYGLSTYPAYPAYPDARMQMGQGQQMIVRPLWAQDLITLYRGRIARQFVLHFNINDYMLNLSTERSGEVDGVPRRIPTGDVVGETGQLRIFRQYLHDLLFDPDERLFHCQAIYTYTLAGGLLAEDRESRGIGHPLTNELDKSIAGKIMTAARVAQTPQQGQQVEGQEVQQRRNATVSDNFRTLGHLLRQRYRYEADGSTYSDQPGLPREEGREAPVAIVLDYAEKFIPYHVGEGQGTTEQLQALEVIQSWAQDPKIRQTDNIIILLTMNIEQIPKHVHGEGSGCRAIRIPLPNEDEREAFIRYKTQLADPRQKLARLANAFAPGNTTNAVNISPEDIEKAKQRTLARSTQGMRLMDIDSVNRRAIMLWRQRTGVAGSEELTPDDVKVEKAASIQSQSSQLLEIVPPIRGFNEIGGLQELKAYLETRARLMASGQHSPLIPSGLLLAGPPGTGKTIIAEALATESGFNLVKMRNIQDRWVGSSERNLDMVLNLLQDLHPVIVFVDEIDQAMGRRDTGQGGDSGVSARMFARILEEMSKAENRGRILWVAATNRTDILDDALLRRFDRVVPLLAPDAEESRLIFAAMPGMIGKQSGGKLNITYGGDLAQSGWKDGNGRPHPTDEDLKKFQAVAERSAAMGLTGAEVEIVVRRAIEYACEEELKQGGKLSETDLPPITSQHLLAAMTDFKINHNPDMYDLQSMLAIRSCNFYSMLPKRLPNRPIFQYLYGTSGRLEQEQINNAINILLNRIRYGGDAGQGGPGQPHPPSPSPSGGGAERRG